MLQKFLGDAKGIFNIVTYIELGISLCCFVIGLIFFTSPGLSKTVVSIIAGILLIFNGVVTMYSYFKRNGLELYNFNLILGIILILLGIGVMFNGKILIVMLGIYYIISGIQKGVYAFLLKKYNEKSWLFLLVVGLLFIVLGIITFFTNVDNLVEVTGICLIGYGLINIIYTILLRHRSSYFIA